MLMCKGREVLGCSLVLPRLLLPPQIAKALVVALDHFQGRTERLLKTQRCAKMACLLLGTPAHSSCLLFLLLNMLTARDAGS